MVKTIPKKAILILLAAIICMAFVSSPTHAYNPEATFSRIKAYRGDRNCRHSYYTTPMWRYASSGWNNRVCDTEYRECKKCGRIETRRHTHKAKSYRRTTEKTFTKCKFKVVKRSYCGCGKLVKKSTVRYTYKHKPIKKGKTRICSVCKKRL